MGVGHNNKHKQKNILVLADFSEGSWNSVEFALEHLFDDRAVVYLLQTWQKPGYGSTIAKDLSPMLRSIAENEVMLLKEKILQNYRINPEIVNTINFEGEVTAFFQSELYVKNDWEVVMSIQMSSDCLIKNPRVGNIIDQVGQPLYVLTGEEEMDIEDVLVVADSEKPSQQMLGTLCSLTTNSNVRVCFCVNENNEHNVKLVVREEFSGKNVSFLRFSNRVHKELNSYIKRKGKQLLVFDKNKQRKLRNSLRGYVDSWLVKTKGIRIISFI
ncbi:hypothetical protein EYV94_01635 [Puteibacter caeruleilacunae]|nr:hypothetical protein EYV94_01635 [Puteibacter caeruleilacunae]